MTKITDTIDVTLEQLLEAGAHLGHQAKRWNPKMTSYLYGVRDGVHVFDLVKTREALLSALNELSKVASEDKKILIVGTKKQAQEKVAKIAKNTDSLYVTQRWLGGTLSNFTQIMKSVKNLSEMKQKRAAGEYKAFTKKERLLIDRKIEKLEKFFGGIASITSLPDLMVIIDTHKEIGAVREAAMLGIPTIGLVDSNADPAVVTFPIPMNDDASGSLNFVLDLFEKAILAGKGTKKTTAEGSLKAKTKKTKKEKTENE